MIEKVNGINIDLARGYVHEVFCKNCKWSDFIYIPYNMTPINYLHDKKCWKCKCKGWLE